VEMSGVCVANQKVNVPQRHHTPRGARRSMKFDSSELHELRLTSELVPSGNSQAVEAMQKSYCDMETASTIAPSSAEQSPELACMESDLKSWPSLQYATDGWNMCDEDSDIGDTWEDLPEPALALEGVEAADGCPKVDTPASESPMNWWLIPGFGTAENTSAMAKNQDAPAKATYADLLRDQKHGQSSLTCGTSTHLMHSKTMYRGQSAGTAGDKMHNDMIEDADEVEAQGIRWHGWKHEHKASWNAKLQRKIATRKLQRQLQSRTARCSSEEEDAIE